MAAMWSGRPTWVEDRRLSEIILKAEAVHTYIGQHHILQGVSFEANADSVTVLIGRNGAGKSTTLSSVMGLRPPSQGSIQFKGQEIHRRRPYEIARMGISYVPEQMGIFTELTTEENMRVAILREDKPTMDRLENVLDMFTDLRKFWNTRAGNLSGGQKQMLAIARAIVNDTALLLIDEPSKGLAPILIEALIEAINKIKAHSVVLLVEQNFYMAGQVGDYFYILDDGRVVHGGDMDTLVKDDALQSRFLGVSKADG